MDTAVRKAKILATLGPASREQSVIESLILAGANGVRINMSHGTREEKTEDIKRARAAAATLNRPLAVLVDLSGPKIRTRQLKDGQPVTLNAGAQFTLTTRDVIGDENQVATNYPDLALVVEPGTRLLLDTVPPPPSAGNGFVTATAPGVSRRVIESAATFPAFPPPLR